MNCKKILSAALMLSLSATSFAGGMLTNTNQSVSFLRNPAQDATININGVYSNPAGVVFLGEGFHFGFSWQGAKQSREITSANPLFALGAQNNGKSSKFFNGDATAPFLPSLQAAYNTGDWSFQFGFGVIGGGGKCNFDNGLGSFEGAVGGIASGLAPFGATGYDLTSSLQGKQYYFGFTLGAAYKVNDNLSVYAGARALYGTAAYKVNLDNIKVGTANGYVPFAGFIDNTKSYVSGNLDQIAQGLPIVNGGIAMLESLGDAITADQAAQLAALKTQQATLLAQQAQLQGAQGQLNALEAYRNGVNLQSDQSGFGIAPIIGVDYKVGNFNLAAKYEFQTRMRLKNKSTVKEASLIGAVNKFRDGYEVPEDMPALLTVGAQWNVVPSVRINAGYHYYFDEQAKKYGDTQKLLDGGTQEFLGGVEWDFTNKWTVSAGAQTTNYGLTDSYMNDMSFVVDSWSFGFGVKYQATEKIAINAAYFQTNYGTYDSKQADSYGTTASYTRTNKVVGIGLELDI